MYFYLLTDALTSYSAASPHGSWVDIAHLKPASGLDSHPFSYRFYYTWVHIVLAYTNLELANVVYGVVSVATGLANPRDCPSMFGDIKGLYTLRNAWS